MSLAARLALVALLVLSACQTPGTYPITGEQCGPDDPVLDIEAPPCP